MKMVTGLRDMPRKHTEDIRSVCLLHRSAGIFLDAKSGECSLLQASEDQGHSPQMVGWQISFTDYNLGNTLLEVKPDKHVICS